MSLTAPELTGPVGPADDIEGPWVSPVRPTDDDTIVVTCAACGARQHASGRASSYSCETCAAAWQVLRCPGCAKASIVRRGVSVCPHCEHDHRAPAAPARAAMPSWLTEPEPLNVWIGGVKYLGGHAARERETATAGLLLDRRGVHLRAFAELFTIRWDTVAGIDIEGPTDISERLTTAHLAQLGASTWALQVAYVTVRTPDGDAIFEVEGLSPPELHARLSRVLQGVRRTERPRRPIAIDRPAVALPAPEVMATPELVPAPEVMAIPQVIATPAPALAPVSPPEPAYVPHAIDPATSDAPLEILVVDALWKLARLREEGLVNQPAAAALRARILAHVAELTPSTLGTDGGPLLRV